MDICTERRLRAQFFLIQTSWLVTNTYMYLCVYTYIVFVLGFLEIEEEVPQKMNYAQPKVSTTSLHC